MDATKSRLRFWNLLIFFWVLGLALGPAAAGAEEPTDLQLFGKLQNTIIGVSEKIKPCVVHIEAFIRSQQKRVKVVGSGILINKEGYILTNSHVVYQAEKIVVTVPGSKKELEPTVIGIDQLTDLAVLQLPPTEKYDISFPAIGDSSKVKVGEWVIAVGNPYGLDGTVSFGIVSAKGRNLDVGLLSDFIQTDAMIDPGSSGGPLANLNGEILGINTMGQGRGIGFTIPIQTAMTIMQGFIAQGSIERGWLGVQLQAFNRKLAAHLKMTNVTGVIVTGIVQDSPAEKSGMRVGDIITAFDNESIEAETEEDVKVFARTLSQAEVGKVVKIELLRGQNPLSIKATIEKQPQMSSDEIETPYGFNVMDITPPIYFGNRLFSMDGMFVTFVDNGSPAGEADLTPGDVIVEIEGTSVRNRKEFEAAISTVEGRANFLVKFYRGKELRIGLLETRSESKESNVAQ